ncbi:hypothetical protein KCU85_g240, partial [Aureobasidium melanogenum]
MKVTKPAQTHKHLEANTCTQPPRLSTDHMTDTASITLGLERAEALRSEHEFGHRDSPHWGSLRGNHLPSESIVHVYGVLAQSNI